MRMRSAIDLHLLRILEALLVTRSVSLAAQKMGLTQPAVSHRLRELRRITGDPLLVRQGGGMQRTECALEILDAARTCLDGMVAIASGVPEFDAMQCDRTFRVAIPDSLEPEFLPRLIASLRHRAPQASLEVRPVTQTWDIQRAFESGDIDLVIGNWPNPPLQLRRRIMFDDEVVCLAGPPARSLLKGGLTRTQFLALPHIGIQSRACGLSDPINEALLRCGVERRIALTVPRCTLAPNLLRVQPMLFTTGKRFAQSYGMPLGLTAYPCPVPIGPLRYYQLWHGRGHASPALRWLRSLCEEAANTG